MTLDWNDLEGVSLAGQYWLKQCLYSTAEEASYLTRFGAACDASVRVISADDESYALERMEAWGEARAIEHPHVLRMLDSGRAKVHDADLIYAVCEYPDDLLARVLVDRPLSCDEAQTVLDACLQVLRFLHGRGLAHGAVDATRIGAVGETVKLPSDMIGRPLGRTARAEAQHAELEAAEGTQASDMWSLGVLLAEILTQQRPTTRAEAGYLPEPFATIVSHTLRKDPAERWSAEEVEAFLRKPAVVAAPEPKVEAATPAIAAVKAKIPETPVIFEPEPEPEPIVRVGHSLKWVPIVGLVAAAGLGALFLPHAKESATQPAAPATAAPAPTPVPASPAEQPAPPAPVAKPSPVTPAATPPVAAPSQPNRDVVHNAATQLSREAIWRVVVYEYSKRDAAEHKVRTLNEKRPAWHAEVFAPRGEHAPYFVALGGRMTRPEAERLKLQARAAGLPRDTFVRNFAN